MAPDLGDWLREQGIGWLCDNPQQFALDATKPHHCGAWFGGGFDPERDLVEWARFIDADVFDGDRAGTDIVALYRFGAAAEGPDRGPRLDRLGPSLGRGRSAFVWVGLPGEELLRDFHRFAPDGEPEPPEVLARAVPGVPLVISLRTPIGTSASVFVSGREDAILHFHGPR